MSSMALFRNKKEFQVGQLGEVGVLIQNMEQQANTTADTTSFSQDTRTMRQFVTNAIKESVYFFEPLTYSGINKTANRMFTEWFRMDSGTFGESMDEDLRQELEDFHKKIHLKAKLMRVCIDSMVYGNGFLELVAGNSVQERNTRILPQSGLKDVVIADPLFIQPRIEWIDQANEEFYYIEQTQNGIARKIHNSRIIHIPWAQLGTMRFGRGVIEIAIRSVLAKLNMDWALGEVIYRHGKPFIVLKTTGAGQKELEKAYKVLQNINPRTHFAGTDRHSFEMLNPSVVDPDPFAKYYYHNLAAACEMPQMEFLGAQAGQLTGSAIDKVGWYANLKAKQSKFTDVIHAVNNQYLKGDWHDEVFWNDILVDEKSAAEIMKMQAETVKILYYDASLMTDIEARQSCRDLGITFPENDNEFISEEAAKPTPPPMPFGQTPVNSMIPAGDQTEDTTGKQQADADKLDFIKSNEVYWNERKTRHALFEPPEAGDLPEAGKKILADVYSSCRSQWVEEHPDDKENPANKEKCAKIAWSAVHHAGYGK